MRELNHTLIKHADLFFFLNDLDKKSYVAEMFEAVLKGFFVGGEKINDFFFADQNKLSLMILKKLIEVF